MSKNKMPKWNNEWSEIALSISSDSVIWVSGNGDLIRFNDAFVKKNGFSHEELKDKSLFDLDENLSKKEWKQLWKTLQENSTATVETVFGNVEEKSIDVELNFTLLSDIDVCCVLIRDISERKKLDQQLKEATLLLERSLGERSEGSKMTLEALSERNQVFQELRELQKHHESILQSVGEGIYGLDHQGFTTFANMAAVKWLVGVNKK